MKRFLLPVIVVILSMRPAHAGDTVSFTPTVIAPKVYTSAQKDILIADITAFNRGTAPCTIDEVRIIYTGTAAADLAGGSVRLFASGTGQIGPGRSFSPDGSIVFDGLSIAVGAGGTRGFYVKADIAAAVIDGDAVDCLADRIGYVVGSTETVEAVSLDSLPAPHSIDVVATNLKVSSPETPAYAGTPVNFTVKFTDRNLNPDKDWTGATFAVAVTGGTPPRGPAPGYSKGAVSGGQSSCSATFYKAEPGARIVVSDTRLADSPYTAVITVLSGTKKTINLEKIASPQQAGQSFYITAFVIDAYENPASGYKDSDTTIAVVSGITDSPNGDKSSFPLRSHWFGDETNGRKVLPAVVYNQCSDAQLVLTDTALETAGKLSDTFVVNGGDVAGYSVQGPETVPMRTNVLYTLTAKDSWGNFIARYGGTALVACSDPLAYVPDKIAFSGGKATLLAAFGNYGAQSITLKDVASTPKIACTITLTVKNPPRPERFKVTVPAGVDGGRPFDAEVMALDASDQIIEEYDGTVRVFVDPPASLSPPAVDLLEGRWRGTLAVTGETLQTGVNVSDGAVTTMSAATLYVTVADGRKARAYPTVFSPATEKVRIRYYLRENAGVTVSFFTMLMDKVGEMSFPAGSPGGRAGLNVIEWDGRGGDEHEIGHSGGYHILIDKGYEKEWTGAVIKNF